MIKTFAQIQNGIVINRILASENDPLDSNFTWVDVTNIQCGPGWTYSEGVFTDPNSNQNLQPTLEEIAIDWIQFGTDLFKEIRKKIWVINASDETITEQYIIALIPHSDLLQKALEGGGLSTAKLICEQLKVALPKYASVCDFAILKIEEKIF